MICVSRVFLPVLSLNVKKSFALRRTLVQFVVDLSFSTAAHSLLSVMHNTPYNRLSMVLALSRLADKLKV